MAESEGRSRPSVGGGSSASPTSVGRSSARGASGSAAAASSAGPLGLSDLQFSLLPVAHSSGGSISAVACWQHAVYVGTQTTTLTKYELELYENEDDAVSDERLGRSTSALRPPLDPSLPANFTLVAVTQTADLDARKYHRVKPTTTTAPFTDIQLCPPLGVLFGLCEGVLCAYDLKGLKFQQRIAPPTPGLIDRFAIYPPATQSLQSFSTPTAAAVKLRRSQLGGGGLGGGASAGKTNYLQLALCMGKKVWVVRRNLDEGSGGGTVGGGRTTPPIQMNSPGGAFGGAPPSPSPAVDTTWQVKAELYIPEAANCVTWIDSVQLLIGFRREYTVLNTITGDVVDLCGLDSSASKGSSGSGSGGAETMLHKLVGDRTTLLNLGSKAVVHYYDPTTGGHVLADAMVHGPSPPKALGTSGMFALTLDSTFLHVYIRPTRASGAWKVTQNIPVSHAGLLWTDGGPLALLTKGAQLYYLQPSHVAEKQKDTMLMLQVRYNYMEHPGEGRQNEWVREEAVKAITQHGQQALAGRTHVFAMMIRAFEKYLQRQIEIHIPAMAPSASSSPLMATKRLSGSGAGAASSASPPPLTAASRAPILACVRTFQAMAKLAMRVLWTEACNPIRTTTPATSAGSGDNAGGGGPGGKEGRGHGKRNSIFGISTSTSNSSASEHAAASAPPEKKDFLPECASLFDEALFRRIYPRLAPIYVASCREEDANFQECCDGFISQKTTMAYFGSQLIEKSPWMKEQQRANSAKTKTTLSPEKKQQQQREREAKAQNGVDIPLVGGGAGFGGVESSSSVPSFSALGSGISSSPLQFTPASSSFHPLSPNPLLEAAWSQAGGPMHQHSASEPVTPMLPPGAGGVGALAPPQLGRQWPRMSSSPPSHHDHSSSSGSTLVSPTPAVQSAHVLWTLLLDAFAPSINLLKMLRYPSSPGSKLKLLTRVHYQLIADAQKVYDPTGTKLFTMSADELLPILCWVLIQSKLDHPFAEAEFLQDFMADDQALGVDGYIITTLQIALSQITHKPSAADPATLSPASGGSSTTRLSSAGITHGPPASPLLASLTQSTSGTLFSPTPIPGSNNPPQQQPSLDDSVGSSPSGYHTPSTSLPSYPAAPSSRAGGIGVRIGGPLPVPSGPPPRLGFINANGSGGSSSAGSFSYQSSPSIQTSGSPTDGNSGSSSGVGESVYFATGSTSPARSRAGTSMGLLGLGALSLARSDSMGAGGAAQTVRTSGIGSSLLAASLQNHRLGGGVGGASSAALSVSVGSASNQSSVPGSPTRGIGASTMAHGSVAAANAALAANSNSNISSGSGAIGSGSVPIPSLPSFRHDSPMMTPSDRGATWLVDEEDGGRQVLSMELKPIVWNTPPPPPAPSALTGLASSSAAATTANRALGSTAAQAIISMAASNALKRPQSLSAPRSPSTRASNLPK